jgi:hypothetical protein
MRCWRERYVSALDNRPNLWQHTFALCNSQELLRV